MVNILIGCFGFLVIHSFDIIALAGVRKIKPLVWFLGFGLVTYALSVIFLSQPKLSIPEWAIWVGWVLIPIGAYLQFFPLFINLPFRKTYIIPGVNKRLIKTGLYALARHPGVMGFLLLMPGLILVSRSQLMLTAAPIFILLDILAVFIQDIYFFPKMFPDYKEYQKNTPIFFPNKRSWRVFINSSRPTNNKEVKTMTSTVELIQEKRYGEIWRRYCGFTELTLEDFMAIQKRLLLEQIELLNRSELGNRIMKGVKPQNINEFRESVPLTTYTDYASFFSRRRKDILPEKPITWMHTSGRSGEYTKWIPVTERRYQEMGAICIAALILCTAKRQGDVNLKINDKWLYALAPPPYMTGTWARGVVEEVPVAILPDIDEAEKLSFNECTQRGVKMALEKGVDLFGGMPSVLLAVGNKFAEGNGSVKLKSLLSHPKMLFRLSGGAIKSKIARRQLLPKDLWKLKGILAGGADTAIYRNRIKEMWGRYPLDLYAFTEGGIISIQLWDYQDMTFIPNLNFYEFIPEEESIKLREDPSYKPKTLLLDEVQPNQNYELVITNLLGGAMIRYRVGDLIRITSLRNEKLNINIPQMAFYSRSEKIIDIAGFTRLTEKTIWQAIENAGVDYKDWTVRKEGSEKPKLHIYLELNNNDYNEEEIAQRIHECLAELDSDYANLESMLNMRPTRVTFLPSGAFHNYTAHQQSVGASLGQMKPTHVNPSETELHYLINSAGVPTELESPSSQREEVTSK